MMRFEDGVYCLYSACKPAWCNPTFSGQFEIKNDIVLPLSKDHALNFDFIPAGPINNYAEYQIRKALAGGNGYYYLEQKRETIIAIGDIHGCISALKLLMTEIEAKYDLKTVKLVFLGDYVDRGEDSNGVLAYLMALKEMYPHFVTLLGNHEYDLIESGSLELSDVESVLLTHQSGKKAWVLRYPDDRYKNFSDWIASRNSFLKQSLSHYFISENFCFVHGGIPDGYRSADQVPPRELVWAYGTSNKYSGKRIICGHAARAEIRESKNSICIDTGCCFPNYGTLTAVVLNDLTGEVVEYLQVRNPTLKNSG